MLIFCKARGIYKLIIFLKPTIIVAKPAKPTVGRFHLLFQIASIGLSATRKMVRIIMVFLALHVSKKIQQGRSR